jgi:16S rRNA (cytidine1402-2'-O)-methyltransferase
MTGVLYIVATPIGNLDDISLRAISTLKAVDLIAAEDTRHSRQLLNHLGIDTRLLSCHQHNEQSRSVEILEKLIAGSDVALISDAGTPLISDPGYRLVSAAQPTDSFHFVGFLSSKNGERDRQLQALSKIASTLVLFESSHRVERLLESVLRILPQCPCVVAKELTKLHERFLHGSAAELLQVFSRDAKLTRGEFVMLIDNTAAGADSALDTDDFGLLEILLDEVSVKMAVKIAMRLTGKKKNEIYQQALKLQSKKDSASEN